MSDPTNFENPGGNEQEIVLEDDHLGAALLAQLRECEQIFGRVPNEVSQGALAAFEFRSFDDDLAILLHDSADSNDFATVRSAALDDVRLVEFRIGAGQLHLGFTDTLISGNVSGRSETSIELVSTKGRQTLRVDEFGDFWCSDFDSGPLRFELGSGSERVVTDWVLSPRR